MSKRGLVLFLAMGVIWGIPYLLIKVAVRDISPADLVFLRTGLAAVILLPIAIARGQLRAILPHWRIVLLYTAVEVAIPWILLSEAEERLPSSLTGLLVAAVPLVGAVLAFAGGDRSHLSGRRLAGLAVGLAGVGVLVGFDVSTADLGAVALVAGVAVGYALGPALVNRYLQDVPSLGVVTASLVLTALAYAPFALTNLPHRHLPPHVILAVVTLAVVCTALAFVVFFALITETGPVRATVITYINPAVAVVLGVVFLHESFGPATAAGFALILSGSFLATRSRRSVPAGPAPSAAPVAPGAAGCEAS